MKTIEKKCILLGLLTIVSLTTFAQSRDFLRNKIAEKGECRNVAITKYNGDLMLYGRNGWAASGCPSSLTDALDRLNDQNEYIDDIQLTEAGRWIILIGNNGFQWNDIPYSLERKLREFNEANEVVLSVTFNDNNDWVVITKNYISASDTGIQEWLAEGNEKFGMLWSVCVTNNSIVAVYEKGYKYYGDVPQSLKDALDNTTINVFRLKIAGSAWFFADTNGRYRYNM